MGIKPLHEEIPLPSSRQTSQAPLDGACDVSGDNITDITDFI